MKLEEKLMQDLKEAMKAKDKARVRSIRAIKAALLLAKTDAKAIEMTNELEIKLLQKLIKQRKDSFDIYSKEGRKELAQIEQEEIQEIMKYLPEQLSPEEISDIVTKAISALNASSMKDMGKVMAKVSKELAGKADGKTIAQIVKKSLM